MRLDQEEKQALRYSLRGFKGDIYLFGSRVDDSQKGGDIDILLVPKQKVNSVKLSLEVQAKFQTICDQSIDIIVYQDNLFCKEILKSAKRIDPSRI